MTSVAAAASNTMSEKSPASARAVPVRVKKKTLKKLTNSEKLEIENSKMEERLRVLRQTIEREKEERSANPRDFMWTSGKPGAIANHAKDHRNKNKSQVKVTSDRKIKVKFLAADDTPKTQLTKKPTRVSTPHNTFNEGSSWAEPQSAPQNPPPALEREATFQRTPRESVTCFEEQPMQRSLSIVGPICGQCELNGAQMNCLECGEKYCSECFAAFHKKGALKSHTSRPLTRQNLNPAPKEVKLESTILEGTLWGEYDEAASAQSFADAVKSWRGGETVIQSTAAAPSSTGNQGQDRQIADSCQTNTGNIPDITFKENENVSYFERMLLQKERSATPSYRTDSTENEITVSQLDFCRDLLQHNIEEDRAISRLSEMQLEEPIASSILIEEISSDTGFIEESGNCVVDEGDDNSESEEDIKQQMDLARQLLSGVKIEEFLPETPDPSNPSTAGLFQHTAGPHAPLAAKDSLNSLAVNYSDSRAATPGYLTDIGADELRSITPPLSESGTVDRPRTPQRSAGPSQRIPPYNAAESIQRVHTPDRSGPQARPSVSRSGRFYTETPHSPLVKRINHSSSGSLIREKTLPIQSNNPNVELLERSKTSDLVVLSSQTWRQSFLGFVKAGLPGYTLPDQESAVPSRARSVLEEEEEVVMLAGPPSWCPGESRTDNEIFQSRENSISFSVSGQQADQTVPSGTEDKNQPPQDCSDLDHGTELEYDSENVLESLGSELNVSTSRDLGDYLHSLRTGTPEPLSLLTHEDRMSQLELESRGISPTATPIISKISVRESLFLDFEDVERQLMAGDENVE